MPGLGTVKKNVSESGQALSLGPCTDSVLFQDTLGLYPVKPNMIHYGRKGIFFGSGLWALIE